MFCAILPLVFMFKYGQFWHGVNTIHKKSAEKEITYDTCLEAQGLYTNSM